MKYRGLVARANYLCQYRSDIQVAIKELCRNMSEPNQSNLTSLKRPGRYSMGKTRVVIEFEYQREPKDVVIWTDADFAGCRRTRKSTC